MTLRLTPTILEASYQFLRSTPPFNRWHLPDGEEVEFHVGRGKTHHGEYEPGETAEHRIIVHETNVGFTSTLLESMAHEMIHVKLAGTTHAKAEHGAEFRKLARLVCKYHGFDPKRF